MKIGFRMSWFEGRVILSHTHIAGSLAGSSHVRADEIHLIRLHPLPNHSICSSALSRAIVLSAQVSKHHARPRIIPVGLCALLAYKKRSALTFFWQPSFVIGRQMVRDGVGDRPASEAVIGGSLLSLVGHWRRGVRRWALSGDKRS